MSEVPVTDRTIGAYLDALASSAPAPGGGSVAGLVGALASALGQMVISLTDRTSDPHPELAPIREQLQKHRIACLAASEADERAYSGYVAVTKLPKTSAVEKATRRHALQEALVESAHAPLGLARISLDLLSQLTHVITSGSTHVLSDADIAATLAHASVTTALVNVRVNINLIKDDEEARALTEEADAIEAQATETIAHCRSLLQERRSA